MKVVFNPNLNLFSDIEKAGFHLIGGNKTTAIVEWPPGSQVKAIKTSLNYLTDTDIERTEFRPKDLPGEYFSQGKCALFGPKYHYSFVVYLKDWEQDTYPEIVAQWHGKPDPGEDIGMGPPLSLRIIDGIWFVYTKAIAVPESKINPKTKRYDFIRNGGTGVGEVKDDINKFVQWNFFVQWGWGQSGRLRVTKNNLIVIDEKGPNCYNDLAGPIFRLGIYKWDWRKGRFDGPVKERTAYYRGIKISAAV